MRQFIHCRVAGKPVKERIPLLIIALVAFWVLVSPVMAGERYISGTPDLSATKETLNTIPFRVVLRGADGLYPHGE